MISNTKREYKDEIGLLEKNEFFLLFSTSNDL